MHNRRRNCRSQLGPRPGDFALGSLESRAAARAVLLARDQEIQEQEALRLKNLPPVELAFLEGRYDPVKPSPALHMMCEAINKRCKSFGWPRLTPEYVRHKRQVLQEVEKIEVQRAAVGDTAFLNREGLRAMAEDRLRCESRDSPPTGSTTAEADVEEKE